MHVLLGYLAPPSFTAVTFLRKLLLATALLWLVPYRASSEAPGFLVVRQSGPVASEVRARDIRFGDGEKVMVATVEGNVDHLVTVNGTWTTDHQEGQVWVGWHLATHKKTMALGSPLREIGVRSEANGWSSFALFEAIEDIDVHQNTLAVLGMQLSEVDQDTGAASVDGAISWTLDLDAVQQQATPGNGPPSQSDTARKDKGPTTPIWISRDGAGARSMNSCTTGRLGSLRFLANGTLAVAPGVEPGVSLFDREGSLVQRWDTTLVGVSDFCQDMDTAATNAFSIDQQNRAETLNQHIIIDDLIEWQNKPALILRAMSGGFPVWGLVVLEDDGSFRSLPLPIDHGSSYSRLKADSRSEQLLILRYEPFRSLVGESFAEVIFFLKPSGQS